MASSDKDTKPSQAGSPVFDGKESDFLLAEYNTLRTELLQRFSTRHQLPRFGPKKPPFDSSDQSDEIFLSIFHLSIVRKE